MDNSSEKPFNLSRRDFLKLTGITAGSLLASACMPVVKSPESIASPAPTDIAIEVANTHITKEIPQPQEPYTGQNGNYYDLSSSEIESLPLYLAANATYSDGTPMTPEMITTDISLKETINTIKEDIETWKRRMAETPTQASSGSDEEEEMQAKKASPTPTQQAPVENYQPNHLHMLWIASNALFLARAHGKLQGKNDQEINILLGQTMAYFGIPTEILTFNTKYGTSNCIAMNTLNSCVIGDIKFLERRPTPFNKYVEQIKPHISESINFSTKAFIASNCYKNFPWDNTSWLCQEIPDTLSKVVKSSL